MPLESAELLPSEQVQSDLVAAMARLVKQHGHEMFVCEPIYEPIPAHFPELSLGSKPHPDQPDFA